MPKVRKILEAMVINHTLKQIHCKIVYYGAPMVGKSTNLSHLHRCLPDQQKSELRAIATENEHTWFFDFLSPESEIMSNHQVFFHVYTSPGVILQPFYRTKVVDEADGVVFVADPQPTRHRENKRSLRELASYLAAQQKTLHDVPIVLQYNKRDLFGSTTRARLDRDLNRFGWPVYEATAMEGISVVETFDAIRTRVIQQRMPRSGTRMISPALQWAAVNKQLGRSL
jgi:mutual gliding-motility protein MglA